MGRTHAGGVPLGWLCRSVNAAMVLPLLPALGGEPEVLSVQAATLTVCPSGPPTCGYAPVQG